MDRTIAIKQGYGTLQFGMPVEEVVAAIGNADKVETIDNAFDEPTTILHYPEKGIILFFEGENPTLTCIDVEDEEAELFGEQVFSLDERTIVRLMVEHGFTEQDVDNEAWGERRVSFGEANIDLFFEQGKLMSITLGA